MRRLRAKIRSNERISGRFYKMRVTSKYLGAEAKPGQFVEVRCSGDNDPLLRRPIGVHRITGDGIEILYEVVGRGTSLLANMRSGDDLDLIGPLVNGFTVQATNNQRPTTVLVAGGIGVAPLMALAEELAHSAQRVAYRKNIQVLIGAKTKNHILCEREFKRLGCNVSIATEDGSRGRKGLVTDLLKKLVLTTYDLKHTTICACGPSAMLKAVASTAKAHDIPCQVSLEERMACGVGVCLGCPIRVRTNNKQQTTNHTYKMVCKDGPVFDSGGIIW